MASSLSSADVARSQDGVLIFDVGANIGNKAAHFASLGARVVCFEPVPECLEALRIRFASDPAVTIVPCAMGASVETLSISISTAATTVSTFSDDWKHGRFKDLVWDKTLDVPVRPLDSAIADYGLPDYCKIDVEGFELSVLRGLSQPIPVLSFEFCKEGLSQTFACIEHLQMLGYRRFNLIYGESTTMRHRAWLDAAELVVELRDHPSPLAWGDIFAACEQTSAKSLAEMFPALPENEDLPTPGADTLSQLRWRGLSYLAAPLRLHLGCRGTPLEEYVNIDDSGQHPEARPDLDARVTSLTFPSETIDDVRVHHVFEQLDHVRILGLLIRWQDWLKPGGHLQIEVADFQGETAAFLEEVFEPGLASRFSVRKVLRLIRNGMRKVRGSSAPSGGTDPQSAGQMLEGTNPQAGQRPQLPDRVGYHLAERFKRPASFGFEDIVIERNPSPGVSGPHGIAVTAVRAGRRTEKEQLETAVALLHGRFAFGIVRPTRQDWTEQLRRFLHNDQTMTTPIVRISPPASTAPPKYQPIDRGEGNRNISRLIAVRLQGGLGNQLFQYAAARSASLRLNTDLIFDTSALNSDAHRTFQLSAFKISGRLTTDKDLAKANLAQYGEPFYHYDEAFETIGAGTLLTGYFQSARYFQDYAAQIRSDLELAAPPSPAFNSYAAAINSAPSPISVHVRRGDMMSDPKTSEYHGICGIDYYRRALKIIEGLAAGSPKYFVFSDDRAAATELFDGCKDYVLVETNQEFPWEDMVLMSLCRHHVLANSSFSWWGAWRNQREDKIVVAPRYWVSPKTLRKLNTADLQTEGTIII